MKTRTGWMLLLLVFLVGCTSTPKIVERLGLSVLVGYDAIEKGKILATSILYQVDPTTKANVQVVANTALTSKGSRIGANRELSNKMVSGQVRVAMFSEELAKKGIGRLVDTFSRDPSIGNMVYITVGKGQSSDIISHRYPEIGNLGLYLYKLIKQNIQGEELMSSTLHEFLYSYYSVGEDPVLPIVERRKNEVSIDEIALFQGDKMVGRTSANDAFYIKLIRQRFKEGNFEVSFENEKKLREVSHSQKPFVSLVFNNISSKAKVKLANGDMKHPTFNIRIQMKAQIQEITSEFDLGNAKVIEILENQLGEALEKEMNQFIAKTQQLKTDPFGFGNTYRASVRHSDLSKEKWRNLYPHAKFHLTIEPSIVRTGVSD